MPTRNNNKSRYGLPDAVLSDVESYCIPVPTDPQYRASFFGALLRLGNASIWDIEETGKRFEVAAWWENYASTLIEAMSFCGEDTDGCRTLSRDNSRIVWYPARNATSLPSGYVVNPWVDITGDNPLVGLKAGDVITDILHIPPLPTIWDHLEDLGSILALGYPSITIGGLMGNGKIRVYLVNILLGGRIITVRDNNLLTTAFLDSNLDTASLPPETYAENVIEFAFEGEGEHSLTLVFVPNVSADIEFLGYGGGFRRVEVCGFGLLAMPEDNCCPETNATLSAILTLLQNGFEVRPAGIGLPPDTFPASDCAPDHFDIDDGDEGDEPALRLVALCYVIHCYIVEILYKACIGMGVPSVVLDLIFPDHLTMPPALHKIVVEYPPLLSLTALIENIAFNGAFTDLVTCAMLTALRGKINTFGSFKDSVITFGGFGSIAVPISAMVKFHNQRRENYNIFNEALDQAMGMETEVEAYTCPCVADCTEDLQLVIVDGRGTISLVPTYTDLYHLVGDPSTFDGTTYHGGVYVKDALGRTLSVWNSDVVELPTQAVLYHHIVGRCGTSDSTGLLGGWAGLTEDTVFVERFYQDQQTGPTDTYYRIKCIDACP